VAPSPSGPAQGAERADGRQADAVPERLDGWKAIAAHLGRDIRTVQRWELQEGLPVRRLEHRQRSSAYAIKAELDAWLESRSLSGEAPDGGAGDRASPPPAAARWSRRRLAVLAALVGTGLAVAMALVTLWPRHAQRGDTAVSEAYVAFAEGEARYLSRRYREAAISLEKAVTLDPGYGKAWAWLAKTYGRLAQPVWAGGRAAEDRAGEAAARAAQLAPDLPDAHMALALAARARGDVEAWRGGARRALQLDARAAEALALLGDSYSGVVYSCSIDQDPELAESYYRRAMDLMPSLTTTASNRAGNLRRLGRYAECVEVLDRTMRDYPDQTPLLGVRGACRLMLGDVDGATADIAPLRNNPRMASLGSLIYLSLLALKTGRTEEGVRDLEAFSQSNPTAPAELIVAETYGLAGHVDRAAAHIKRALTLDATCARFVANAVAFRPLLREPSIQALLRPGGAS
jgi:tetratricopeptide (TPR) repeat protein